MKAYRIYGVNDKGDVSKINKIMRRVDLSRFDLNTLEAGMEVKITGFLNGEEGVLTMKFMRFI